MTTLACPHGAYVIKKQDTDSESSVAPNKKQNTESDSSVNKNRDMEPRGSVAVNRPVRKPVGTSASVSRPRRVGIVEPDSGIPSLRGAETTLGPNLSTLTGTTSIGTQVSASSNAVPALGPEEVSEGDVVRVDTTLVTVPVSVLDRQGRFVPNLRREDFSVFENDIEQSIAYFEPAEKPFTVALVLDTSASTHFHLWEIKEAAIAFASQLRPQDRVLVVSFND